MHPFNQALTPVLLQAQARLDRLRDNDFMQPSTYHMVLDFITYTEQSNLLNFHSIVFSR